MELDRPFRGSAAVDAGAVTAARLRGPAFRRLFEDVYVAAEVPVDLALRSRAAHLLVEGRGVLAAYSAAEILGASCASADAPAEVAVPAGCLLRQPDLRVHRGLLWFDEMTTVAGLGTTTRAARRTTSRGTRRHYLDLAYPRYKVGIEYDGGEHRNPERARRDLERQHRLSLLDRTIVRPRAVTVLRRMDLVALDVWRELDQAAERLGLPRIARP